jgi:SAM-dependent methyltransferase
MLPEVTDAAFDELFPADVRPRSELHWTSVAIARRAIAMLDGATTLDVGCGVGKVCLLALLEGQTWWGVDHDAVAIEAANHAAYQLGLRDRARFIHASAWDLDWDRFDGFYFFNPFPVLPEDPRNAFQKYGAFVHECTKAEQRLAALKAGTRVVTYHGFGGDMPEGWDRIAREPAGTDELALWLRR